MGPSGFFLQGREHGLLYVDAEDPALFTHYPGQGDGEKSHGATKIQHGHAWMDIGRQDLLGALEEPDVAATDDTQEALFKIKCPECDLAGTLAFEEGCLKCHGCGYAIC